MRNIITDFSENTHKMFGKMLRLYGWYIDAYISFLQDSFYINRIFVGCVGYFTRSRPAIDSLMPLPSHCLSKHRGAKGHGTYNIPNRLACHQYRGAVAGVLFIVARTLTYLFSLIHRPIELVSSYSSSSS